MPATAAIYHHPDVIESSETPLAGRRVAGQSFLAGYARHVEADTLHCVADSPKVIEHFRELVTGYGWKGPIQGALMRQPNLLANPGTVMLPGPRLGPHAWVRRRSGQRVYSLCGITHTVSTKRIMDGLFNMLSAPVEEWDAVICTSRSVHDVVAAELDETRTYLARRFGARRVPSPQLPIIPLGIDTARFSRDEAARKRYRERFDVGDDDILVMSMGRLSVYAKMHPAPLLLALQRAARLTGRRTVLVMVGWFADEATDHQHRAMTALAPDVTVHFPDGKDQELRYEVWSAADIFALPVDNIQETFGLAPIEAMAASLPVVCSDWNGFKDTVENGTTGFRVRTFMSPPGTGAEIAQRFEDNLDNYFQYLGLVHQSTMVDVREMAEAFATLINDPERRQAMGAAGLERARRLYDWSVIVPQYQALWGELNARRTRGLPSSPREHDEGANPAAIDPFTLYGGYPTARLPVTALLSADAPFPCEEVEKYIELTGANRLRRAVTNVQNLAVIHAFVLAQGPIRLDELISRSGLDGNLVTPAVLWLAKFDRIQVRV